jgi:hypothetical protein
MLTVERLKQDIDTEKETRDETSTLLKNVKIKREL